MTTRTKLMAGAAMPRPAPSIITEAAQPAPAARPNAASPATGAAGSAVVNEDQAALIVGLSARTLQRLRVDGDGPPYVQLTPNGSRIGYLTADLHAWLADRRVASTSNATVRQRGAK